MSKLSNSNAKAAYDKYKVPIMVQDQGSRGYREKIVVRKSIRLFVDERLIVLLERLKEEVMI